ncbi:MAG: hypothetical protein AAF587_31040 [Bacteroidota bacterium]
MIYEDLPVRWKQKIADHLQSLGESERKTLSSSDFILGQKAVLHFEDGSHAEFRYPLLIHASELQELGLFTEHCGYHLFRTGGLSWALVED